MAVVTIMMPERSKASPEKNYQNVLPIKPSFIFLKPESLESLKVQLKKKKYLIHILVFERLQVKSETLDSPKKKKRFF